MDSIERSGKVTCKRTAVADLSLSIASDDLVLLREGSPVFCLLF